MPTNLLFDITCCKTMNSIICGSAGLCGCTDIVMSQAVAGHISMPTFQLPEPWCGDLINAPVLVVSSNPAISHAEMFPGLHWPKNMIADFFVNRFKDRGVKYSWVYDNKVLLKTGARGKSVKYWSSIRKRVGELLNKPAIPGVDYCITELVHCKSNKEFGVSKAVTTCASLYLNAIISKSDPCIILAIGSFARSYFKGATSFGKIPIIYLPHPAGYGPKTLGAYYSAIEISKLRNRLSKCISKRATIINKEQPFGDLELPTDDEVEKFIDKEINKSIIKQ